MCWRASDVLYESGESSGGAILKCRLGVGAGSVFTQNFLRIEGGELHAYIT